MKIAAIYDIHGNLPALEAVIDDIRAARVDQVVVGGDVFPGPMSGDALAALLALDMPVRFILGNGDREVLAWRDGAESTTVPEPYRDALRWVARQVQPAQEHVISSWPATLQLEVNGGRSVLFCHATPRSDTEIITRRTSDDRARALLEGVEASLIVCGHTHMQFDRSFGTKRVVNAGSVGMPFGEPGAYWLLIGDDVELRRTSYDLDAAAHRIRGTAYPMAEQFAADNVLNPPSEEHMLQAFTRAEGQPK